jgi:hypothetical protein
VTVLGDCNLQFAFLTLQIANWINQTMLSSALIWDAFSERIRLANTGLVTALEMHEAMLQAFAFALVVIWAFGLVRYC